mgnify:CR=1 FL=1|jgi:hypothetical protein
MMFEQIYERFDHPIIVWLVIIGVTMFVVGAIIETLGRQTLAGYIGLFATMTLLFAVITFGPLLVLKKTSPLFMNYDSGSTKQT